jgi:hypothetical protein
MVKNCGNKVGSVELVVYLQFAFARDFLAATADDGLSPPGIAGPT